MKITPEGWEYTSKCWLVKDNFGTIPVHSEDIDEQHYELIDRYVADYCLYFVYRPRGVILKKQKTSLLGRYFERILGL